MLHSFKDLWKLIQIHQYYTIALTPPSNMGTLSENLKIAMVN